MSHSITSVTYAREDEYYIMHYTLRCKICNLRPKYKEETEMLIKQGHQIRKIADLLKEKGIEISPTSVFRHRNYLLGRKKNIEKRLEKYIKTRNEDLKIKSLSIEKESLSILQEKANQKGISFSIILDYLIWEWFNQKNKLSAQEIVDGIYQHRIESGWLDDRRDIYKNAIRKSVTLFKSNILKLDKLHSKMYDYVWKNYFFKEKTEQLLREKGKKPYLYGFQRFRLKGLSEVINAIIRLSLHI